ncbi:MAG TPA: polysaccharide biosynthesis C-terminal domain-containing protein, partial [Candidatus Ozemobacteraceae bacterium]|nr:polysaccharide biosynthesis C-terminal domain-containing protein [Candidatus Ozemobacteraceae bacterium]
ATLYRKRMSRLYSLLIWLSITIAIVVQMIGKPFIVFLFGQSYAQASAVLVLHIWAGLFVSIGVVNSQWFLSRNQQGTGALFTVAGAVTNIILNFVLIPPFGIIGAAAATTISYAGAAFLFPMIHPRTRELFFLISRSFILRSR